MKSLLSVFGLALIITVCGKGAALTSGVDRSFFDPSVRFQDDLFFAANGHWLATTEIPADLSNYGALQELENKSRERLGAILREAAASSQSKGSDRQKLGDLYRSYMNTALVEKAGLDPLKAWRSEIQSISSVETLVRAFGSLTQIGVDMPLNFSVNVDRGNSKFYLPAVGQSGLGLPDRDYYLKDDDRSRQSRTAYLKYIEAIFTLSGKSADSAHASAEQILALETALAKLQWTRVELRDPEKTFHKTPVRDLDAAFPGIFWREYFLGLRIPKIDQLDVLEPSYITGLGPLLRSQSLDTWRQYLELRLISGYIAGLSRAFEIAHFELYGKVLAGVPSEKTREKKAVELIAGSGLGFGLAGDLVGKIYVAKYFPSSAKARMDRLVKNLLAAYEESVSRQNWLSEATKNKTRAKLKQYSTLIGYPLHPRTYATLSVEADNLLGNLISSEKCEYTFQIGKIGTAVDREEWELPPQTVNAYYEPSKNQIVFPAAILQAPLFNAEADDAVNYGAIGAIIGHEISHGFDDEGSKYDGSGNLKDWWTAADRSAFQTLTARLVSQFNAYEPLPGNHVNGALTLGENIADLSGISIAFNAYQRSLRGKKSPVIDGLTGEQRFFIGWAQGFHRKYRESELAKRLLTDPHSPSQFRVNGPVSNLDGFYSAFNVKPGDKMYKPPEERIHIW